MPTTVLSRQRSWIAIFAVLAMVASIMVIATPAQAALQDTSATCPDSIPSAGFTDLGGLDAATVQAIDCLAFYGISQGTSATTYSPNASVARWQMALFLTRSLTTMGVALPDGSDQGFTDIGGHDAATQKAINQLAQLNITKGTTATTFAPDDNVSRWQMALFLTRTVTSAGQTLPDGSSQGFTDIGGHDAATQTAINQTVQLGISNGTSATTFSPDPDTLRWHMALFLTRTLATDGVVPAGLGNFVTTFDPPPGTTSYTYADANACTTVKVTTKTTDSFTVNGAAATSAAFYVALASAGNESIQNVGSTHILDTGVSVKSGVVATTDFIDDYTIEEPVSGNTLATYDVDVNPFIFYVVDGTATTLAGWQANVSQGDTITQSGGNGTTAAKARTFTLSNGALSGTIVTPGDPTTFDTACQRFTVDTDAPLDTFSYSVDGVVVADETAFNTSSTAGDLVTYERSSSKSTWTRTNAAPSAVTGLAHNFVAATNASIAVSSTTSLLVVYASDGQGGGAIGTLVANGVISTLVDFEKKLSLGDTLTYQADNTATAADESRLTLVDGPFTGKPVTNGANTVTVSLNGQTSAGVDYSSAGLTTTWTGLSTTNAGVLKYQIDGGTAAAANLGAFSTAIDLGIAQLKGNVSVAKVGDDVVWSVTTS